MRGIEPAVLFALDATTPTALASVLEPLAHLGDTPVAVLAPHDVASRLPGDWTVRPLDSVTTVPRGLRDVRAVVSAGHFLAAGFAAHVWAEALGAEYFVVQHGLLTPFMAPLAPRSRLLAFSDRDAQFWRSSRTDVTAHVVGSQLLWSAADRGRENSSVSATDEPVFLGQLHGAELPRRISGSTAQRFCLQTGAEYRPHPAEVDRLSKFQHSMWRRRGVGFAKPGALLDERRPVVSIFSTGVLEAAAAGIPSWVTCERPPMWVREFWDRYELSMWGSRPTSPPVLPDIEPARAIAQHVEAAVGGER
ncbi:RNA-binding protein [Microbacterium esteraromaticum]|uniref:RNA-binding protein n=1 Tax=Microbacterium esteraromaticum TaxID=57043 RepID=UPI00195D5DCE|nr:RNA-binding protein [Microbacterium esteraromaticum]MBM7466698.1 hypothetical protein [Microbacterium esteraromaticum]